MTVATFARPITFWAVRIWPPALIRNPVPLVRRLRRKNSFCINDSIQPGGVIQSGSSSQGGATDSVVTQTTAGAARSIIAITSRSISPRSDPVSAGKAGKARRNPARIAAVSPLPIFFI